VYIGGAVILVGIAVYLFLKRKEEKPQTGADKYIDLGE